MTTLSNISKRSNTVKIAFINKRFKLRLHFIPFITTFLTACLLCACDSSSNTNSNITTPTSWKTFKQKNYSVEYPEMWTVDASGKMGTEWVILSPINETKDLFRANVGLLIQDLSNQPLDLDQYTQLSKNQVKQFFNDSEFIKSQKLSAKNRDYHELIYTAQQGKYHFKFHQYYWIESNQAYVLTFTTRIDQNDDYETIRERMMNSFQFQ